MMTLFPMMALTALNSGVQASVMIPMMVDSMKGRDEWGQQEKTSYALLCMLGIGVGEILGAIAFGRITDKLKYKSTVIINVTVLSLAFSILIIYAAIYSFSFSMACTMTFAWGCQDAGLNCLLYSFLGFQFASKTTPFSVYKFLESLLIVIIVGICSATQTQ